MLLGVVPANGQITLPIDFLPEFLQIGETSDVTTEATSLQVSTSGQTRISLASAAAIDAVAEFGTNVIAGLGAKEDQTAKVIRLADGRINKSANITIFNSGAGVKNVYGFSTGFGKNVREITQESILASSAGSYSEFDSLLVAAANLQRATLVGYNDYSEDYLPSDLSGLAALQVNLNSVGRLNGFIPVVGVTAKRVQLFATSGGNLNVIVSRYKTA